MKNFLLLLAAAVALAIPIGATPVMFPLKSFFYGANYTRGITITAVRGTLTDGTNIFVGSFINLTPSGGTNPIVNLAPNDYTIAFADVRTPLRFSVPDSSSVVNVLQLITNGLSSVYPYVVGGGGGAVNPNVITNTQSGATLDTLHVTTALAVSNGPVYLQGGAYIESESGVMGIYADGGFNLGDTNATALTLSPTLGSIDQYGFMTIHGQIQGPGVIWDIDYNGSASFYSITGPSHAFDINGYGQAHFDSVSQATGSAWSIGQTGDIVSNGKHQGTSFALSSSGAVKAMIDTNGNFNTSSNVFANSIKATNGITVQSLPGKTNNLLTLNDTNGANLLQVSSNGVLDSAAAIASDTFRAHTDTTGNYRTAWLGGVGIVDYQAGNLTVARSSGFVMNRSFGGYYFSASAGNNYDAGVFSTSVGNVTVKTNLFIAGSATTTNGFYVRPVLGSTNDLMYLAMTSGAASFQVTSNGFVNMNNVLTVLGGSTSSIKGSDNAASLFFSGGNLGFGSGTTGFYVISTQNKLRFGSGLVMGCSTDVLNTDNDTTWQRLSAGTWLFKTNGIFTGQLSAGSVIATNGIDVLPMLGSTNDLLALLSTNGANLLQVSSNGTMTAAGSLFVTGGYNSTSGNVIGTKFATINLLANGAAALYAQPGTYFAVQDPLSVQNKFCLQWTGSGNDALLASSSGLAVPLPPTNSLVVGAFVVATNGFVCSTNYVAANFSPRPGLVIFAASNNWMFAVTVTRTNPIVQIAP